MKAARVVLVFSAMFIGGANTAGAQVTQTITYLVSAINQISIVGTPSLSVTTATAGSAPTTASDATSVWAVTTNTTGAKVSASIATAMPTGLTLSVNLGAPTAATSAGLKTLGTVAVDLVTSITTLAQSGLLATYHLDATAAAGVVASATKVVTYTITSGS